MVPANAFFSLSNVRRGPTFFFNGIFKLRLSAATAARSVVKSLPAEYGGPCGGEKPRLEREDEERCVEGEVMEGRMESGMR